MKKGIFAVFVATALTLGVFSNAEAKEAVSASIVATGTHNGQGYVVYKITYDDGSVVYQTFATIQA